MKRFEKFTLRIQLPRGVEPQLGFMPGRRRTIVSTRELPPVTMVHRPSPYSDVSSLYDLYVRTSSHHRTPHRFGAEVLCWYHTGEGLGTRWPTFLNLVKSTRRASNGYLSLQMLSRNKKSEAMEKLIRVLVANRPKLMREVIIATLIDQHDIEVVGEVTEESEILPQVKETQPDFLFIALDDPDKRPPVCDAVLRMHPEVNIIAVAPHTNRSMRYWASFDIHSSSMETSEESILDAIRKRAAMAREAI